VGLHCKAYEIRGPDPARTAGAVRCHRNADSTAAVDGRTFPICITHDDVHWTKFVQHGWLFVLDPRSEPTSRSK
jgi:hypothetical protein